MRPTPSGRPTPNDRRSSGRWLAATLVGVLLTAVAPTAVADPDGAPSRAEVESARDAADAKERDVAAVRAELAVAAQRVREAGIAVAQAHEAWNEAVWEVEKARRDVAVAERRAAEAEAALAEHATSYGRVVAATYEMSPQVTTLAAIVGEDGIDGVVERANAMWQTTSSMAEVQAGYEAALSLSGLATDRAEQARDRAAELEAVATRARDAALAQEQAAADEQAAVSAQRDQLIAELAELQDISVALAEQRQVALEQAALERAAAAAAAEQAEAEATAEQVAGGSSETPDRDPAATPDAGTPPASPSEGGSDPAPQPAPEPDPQPAPEPDPQPAPQPAPEPAPQPEPDPTPPPASTTGAQRAISFARAQLGEDYQWGATGPNQWDCSGLTMRAWESGGKWIGRTSRQQYANATPIERGQLRPGDLLFWTNGGPSSIYHVAMYTGDGMIIHAPNSSRPVVEESMYYWPPQLYARPS